MTERERDHVLPTHAVRSRDDGVAPGRSSRSAALDGPDAPVMSGLLMRKGDGAVGNEADAEAAVARAGGGGSELPAELRTRFEGSLGTDLSGVRIHTDSASQDAASAVGAKAYALGNDVHFAAGHYDPSSAAGQELIAHEVAHTVQQRGGSPGRQHKLAVSSSGDHLELEADRAAVAMVAGTSAEISSGGVMVSRKGEESDLDKVKNAGKGTVGDEKVSLPNKSISMSLWGKSVSFSAKDGAVASVTLPINLPKRDFVKLETKLPVQVGPGGGMLVFKGAISGEIAASVSISGGTKEFPGPRESSTGYAINISASGGASLKATGRVEALLYAGAGWANVNAGGYVTLGAAASAKVTGGGEATVSPDGTLGGSASIGIDPSVTVEGTGGITVGWEALFVSGKFYEAELASHEFVVAKMPRKGTYDFATGATTDDKPEPSLTWKPIAFTSPKQIDKKLGKTAADAAKRAAEHAKAQEKKEGRDHDAQKSVDPDEGKSTEDTGCDAANAECETPGA